MKFHIGKNGPAECKATKRACPVGGAHFDSMTEAVKTFEESMAVQPTWMQPFNKKHKFPIDYTTLFKTGIAPDPRLKTFAQDFRNRVGRDAWIKLEADNLALTPNNGFVFNAKVAGRKATGTLAPFLTEARVEIRPNFTNDTYSLKVFHPDSHRLRNVQDETGLSIDELVDRVRKL